jgi:hypothetical protein
MYMALAFCEEFISSEVLLHLVLFVCLFPAHSWFTDKRPINSYFVVFVSFPDTPWQYIRNRKMLMANKAKSYAYRAPVL